MDKDLTSLIYFTSGSQNPDLSGFSKQNGFVLLASDTISNALENIKQQPDLILMDGDAASVQIATDEIFKQSVSESRVGFKPVIFISVLIIPHQPFG